MLKKLMNKLAEMGIENLSTQFAKEVNKAPENERVNMIKMKANDLFLKEKQSPELRRSAAFFIAGTAQKSSLPSSDEIGLLDYTNKLIGNADNNKRPKRKGLGL